MNKKFHSPYWIGIHITNMSGRNTVCAISGDKYGERIKSPQLTTKFRFPGNIDEAYMKFLKDLIMRDVKGEKIDYAKESTNFWNRKMKEAVENSKKSMKNLVC